MPGEAIGAYPCHGQHGTQAVQNESMSLPTERKAYFDSMLDHFGIFWGDDFGSFGQAFVEDKSGLLRVWLA